MALDCRGLTQVGQLIDGYNMFLHSYLSFDKCFVTLLKHNFSIAMTVG